MALGENHKAAMFRQITFVVASDFERQVVSNGILRMPKGADRESVKIENCRVGFTDAAPLEKTRRPAYLVSTGFAAGIEPNLASGTILLPKEIIDRNSEALKVDAECHQRIQRDLAIHFAVDTTPVIEASEILASPAEKAAARRCSDVSGADMESASIATYCKSRDIPFLALRVVLDPAHACMPRSIVSATANGNVPGVMRVVTGLIRQPSDWRPMLALLRYVHIARQILSEAVYRSMPALLETAADR